MKYLVSDNQVSLVVEADTAKDAADSWADGDWGEGKALIDVRIATLDEEGNETGEVEYFYVEVGNDPEPPECTENEHDWQSPYQCVGGIKENPGVWSLGGTAIMQKECCANCGAYRIETSYGVQRNPGQCDVVEYREPDEDSLNWIAKKV